jgi:hypothetical protein
MLEISNCASFIKIGDYYQVYKILDIDKFFIIYKERNNILVNYNIKFLIDLYSIDNYDEAVDMYKQILLENEQDNINLKYNFTKQQLNPYLRKQKINKIQK